MSLFIFGPLNQPALLQLSLRLLLKVPHLRQEVVHRAEPQPRWDPSRLQQVANRRAAVGPFPLHEDPPHLVNLVTGIIIMGFFRFFFVIEEFLHKHQTFRDRGLSTLPLGPHNIPVVRSHLHLRLQIDKSAAILIPFVHLHKKRCLGEALHYVDHRGRHPFVQPPVSDQPGYAIAVLPTLNLKTPKFPVVPHGNPRNW